VPFTVFKFRSMYVDAEEQLMNSDSFNQKSGIYIKKVKNDARVTRLGQFLRATAIDELPQFINVVWGDLSLVGPRPLAMYEHERLGEYESIRTQVKPGLTCIWQVSGRNLVDAETRMAMDMEYVNNNGFFIDLVLIFKTVPALITRRGAF